MCLASSGSNFDTLIGFSNGQAPATIDDDTLCSNDRSATDADSQIELSTTTAGKQYLLQVGGCNDDLNAGQCPLESEGRPAPRPSLPSATTRARSRRRSGRRPRSRAPTPGPRPKAASRRPVAARPSARASGSASTPPQRGARGSRPSGSTSSSACSAAGGCLNDDTGDSNTSEVSLDVTPGAYFIQIAGKGAGENATFGNFRYRADFTRAPVVVPPTPPIVTPPVVITEPPPQTIARVRTTFEHLGVWVRPDGSPRSRCGACPRARPSA